MDVYIENLSFKTIIGILPFERVKKQKVIVNLSFSYKYDDEKKDFVDYSLVVNDIKSIMKKKKFELIEEAILYLEKKLCLKYPISNLCLKITKPTILKDCKVSVGKTAN